MDPESRADRRTGGVLALALSLLVSCTYTVPDVVRGDGGGGLDGAAFDTTVPPSDGNLPEAGGTLDGPSCGQGLVCAPAPPTGWSFVTLAAPTQVTCPSGYGNEAILLEGPTGAPATCTCQCGGPPNPDTSNCMANQPVAMQLFSSSACSGGMTQTINANGGNCGVFTGTLSGTYELIQPPPPVQAQCPGTITSKTSPVTSAAQWRSCAVLSPPPTQSCSAGQLCVPQVLAPYTVCVAASGAMPCPPGYPTLHDVGPGVNDTRGCTGTCACQTTDTCMVGTVYFYKTAACSTVVTSLTADGTCDVISLFTGTIGSYRYSANLYPNSTCTTATVNGMPSGGVSLAGEETVCCP